MRRLVSVSLQPIASQPRSGRLPVTSYLLRCSSPYLLPLTDSRLHRRRCSAKSQGLRCRLRQDHGRLYDHLFSNGFADTQGQNQVGRHFLARPSVRTHATDSSPNMLTCSLIDSALDVLDALTKTTGTSKAWRSGTLDAFFESNFFDCSPATGSRWRSSITAALDVDRDRLIDIISESQFCCHSHFSLSQGTDQPHSSPGRAAVPPSANIFVNRDAETQARVLNLRRLAFVLYSAKRDHYLLQLPSIQELLVEVLRTDSIASVVRQEAYLCLRVLVCRVSAREMTSLWPVLLTDLVGRISSVSPSTSAYSHS